LEILIFYLNLECEEMPIEEFTQLVGEENIDAKYNMAKLGNLARDRGTHLGLDLNEEPMEGIK
jgi:hypothetical protein